jgi:gliding motility-associated-like protein
VACEEYRDGVLLGTHIRDFQFNVVACTPLVIAQMEVGDITFDDTTPDDEYLNCEDFTVVFDNTSSGADSYLWDFGDGTTSTVIDPTHTYTDTGTYYVMLIANPGFVCADTAIGIIELYNTLTADYTFVAGCSGVPVVFDDQSVSTEAGDIITWDWNFGDGSTSDDQDPSYEYADGGVYDVVLTVETDKGCVSSVTYEVLVESGPAVDFVADDVCLDEEANFNNLTTIATGTITGYEWDFGDGGSSTEEEPSYQYTTAGTYEVTLIAYSANGCTDTMTHTITIGELPYADAGPDETVEYLETYTLNGSGNGTFTWLASPPLNGVYDTISNIAIANPWVELEVTTTFYLTVVSPDGCVGIDTVTIFVEPKTIINVPNAFSPNGDGINDEILVITHDVSELLEYSIYNRWGEQIFTTTDLGKGWNGQVEGEDADIGTYVYIVRAIGFDDVERLVRGNITLVR